ncbi:MAG: class I SAM-dependent methyltransferase [Pseudomonas sp.]|uniref:SAM-dependent methyltransferase n=1 Tax=Pseudomonas abieticivorans TaxID=2931382 RepID=UPI0020BE3CC4|nr:class I SAM-dependent methyltransferase [Pseudomonas sp. PIA16]MDE1169580.1 class I SAM-dependent methyltransferase [Pseudomonas sp.]
MTLSAPYFEQLFAESDDPWAFKTRWYEQRKRDLTLAALPRQRYRRVFEPACANGELSLRLAQRSDAFVGMDLCTKAVTLARERLAHLPGIDVLEGRLPKDWPQGRFDLIVLSELAYYLTPGELAAVIQRVLASLTADGAVLACHWLHPIEGCAMDGRQVHAQLAAQLPLQRLVRHEEADFVLELWTATPHAFDLDERTLQGTAP